MVAITFVVEMLLFSVTGERVLLFVFPYALLLMVLVKTKNPLAYFSLVLSFLIILGMGLSLLFGSLKTADLFNKRTLLEPALISFFYYDYFSQHGITYLSQHSFVKDIVAYPYDLDPPNLIGKYYYDNPETHANNGFFADAYMNFGFLGFLIWPFILAFFLELADGCSRARDKGVALATLGIAAVLFTNVELLTAFFTNGLILGLAMVYLLPKQP